MTTSRAQESPDSATSKTVRQRAAISRFVAVSDHGTSASLGGELPPLPDTLLAADGVAYDMMYAAEPTVFLQWAAAHGGRGIDGLGMLIEQAAESFFLWRQVRPDTALVRETLRREL